MRKKILLLFLTFVLNVLVLKSNDFIGISSFENAYDLTDYKLVNNNLYVSILSLGVISIDLDNSNYIGIYNDTIADLGDYGHRFDIEGNNLVTSQSKIYNLNNFESSGVFDSLNYADVCYYENYFYTIDRNGVYSKRDKTNYNLIKSEKYNSELSFIQLDKGNFVFIKNKVVSVVDKEFKLSSFEINKEPYDFRVSGDFIIIEFD
ncbi:MAG: hypothetical protein RIF34_00875, partial [Candidatus Kapaibacterium sp.]